MMQSNRVFFKRATRWQGSHDCDLVVIDIVTERSLSAVGRVDHRSDTPRVLLLRVKFVFLLIHSLMPCRVNRLLKRF